MSFYLFLGLPGHLESKVYLHILVYNFVYIYIENNTAYLSNIVSASTRCLKPVKYSDFLSLPHCLLGRLRLFDLPSRKILSNLPPSCVLHYVLYVHNIRLPTIQSLISSYVRDTPFPWLRIRSFPCTPTVVSALKIVPLL